MQRDKVNFSGRNFPQQDLKIVKMVGSGNWSDVYMAYNLKQTQKYAVKVISQKKFKQTPKLKLLTQGEKSILKSCNHLNVIKMYRDFVRQEHEFLVLQYCDGGDLGELLQRQETISENLAIKYLFEIINGFKGLHSVNAMHRDFKVENVMLHEDCCKIVDLGFGKQFSSLDEVTQTKLGSNLTMAPQVMQRLPYGIKADIWSIGVVFYQLLEGTYPFKGRNIEKIMEKIKQNQILYNKVDLSEEAKDFIKRCLVVDPKGRIDWKDIYEHPLFTGLGRNKIVNNSQLLNERAEENKEYYRHHIEERDILKSEVYKILDNLQKEDIDSKEKQKQPTKEQIVEKQAQVSQEERMFRKPNKVSEIKANPYLQAQKKEEEKQSRQIKVENYKKQTQEIPKNQVQKIKIQKLEQIHNKSNHIDSFLNQAYISDELHKLIQKYLQKFDNCRMIPELLYNRYQILRRQIPGINHEYYLSMLWKDSYLKLQDFINSIRDQRNFFDSPVCEVYLIKYKEVHLNSFCFLLGEIKKQFKVMVNLAKQKQHQQNFCFQQESQLIQGEVCQQHSWHEYICDFAREYWMELAKYKQELKHTGFYEKLLVYIFCLAEFERQNRTKQLSFAKVERAINKFDVKKAQINIGIKMNQKKKIDRNGKRSGKTLNHSRKNPAKIQQIETYEKFATYQIHLGWGMNK